MISRGSILRSSVLVLGFVVLASLPDWSSRRTGNPEFPGPGLAFGAEGVTLDRAAREFKAPNDIVWRGPNGGTQSANLVGDPSKPGLYVQLLKRPANNWSNPHTHNHDRLITVLEGTFWIGTGSKLDKEATIAMPKGSFVRDIANQMHYDGTHEDGVVLEIVGIVPPAPASAAN
jgi:hypothetical protein